MNIPFSGRSFSNSGKRLLITFCLDVSPSMGSEILGKKSAITILNETVSGIVEELSKDKKLKSMVELMFVTFCTDLLHVERMPLNQFSHREFSEEPVGGSDIPNAVLSTFKLIDERIADYRKAGIRYHSPIFVLISDGNPDYEEADEIERNAMRMVNERCRSDVTGSVCPFIIGIGDELNENTRSTMAGYARGFMDGYFHIMGDEELQTRIAKIIVKLFGSSVKCVAQSSNQTARSLGEAAGEMNRVHTQINATIQEYRNMV
ncbi:MAG: hypothetical protein II012_02095 [Ruminococcus sp.]|nr:hypothetical protein [Ruminococcus sp.]